MKITEKQVMILADLAKWFVSHDFHGFCEPFSKQTIREILNQIINQHSDVLIDLDKELK